MNQKVFTIILVLTIIGGLAWYLDRNYLQSENNPQSETPSPGSSSNSTGSQADLFYVTSGAAREIWRVDLEEGVRKIFTDADEREKIVKFSNLAASTGEVVAVTASNKLVKINLKNPKLEILQDSFSKPDTLSLSASGNQIVYTRFSNIEENYGYTLYQEDKTGQNKRTLLSSESTIFSPSISPDNTQIVFAATSGTEAELNLVDIESGDKRNLAKFAGQIIESVDWQNGRIYFTTRGIAENSGIIYKIDPKGEKEEKITTFEGGTANFLSLFNDKIAYLVGQYAGKLNDTTSGQIYVIDIPSLVKTPLKKGVQILGWSS